MIKEAISKHAAEITFDVTLFEEIPACFLIG